jgi:predicted acyltransferase
MESIPAPPLVVIEAAFLFGIFVKLLDDPASMGQQNQTLQRGVFRQHAEPVLDLLFFLLLWFNRSRLWVITNHSHGF